MSLESVSEETETEVMPGKHNWRKSTLPFSTLGQPTLLIRRF